MSTANAPATSKPRRVQLARVNQQERYLLADRKGDLFRVVVYTVTKNGKIRYPGTSAVLREAVSRALGADADADEVNLVAAYLNAVELPLAP